MWFEILPSAVIIMAAAGAPHIAAFGLNYIFNGNLYRRSLLEHRLKFQYIRDMRLSGGNPYKVMGLENIPDE